MPDTPNVPENAQTDGQHELKDWETPELVLEDVQAVTQGGMLSSKPSGDDVWYKS